MRNFFQTAPTTTFFKEAREAIPQHTPDLCVVEQSPNHLVFEYGERMTHVPRVYPAFTDERLSLWQRTDVPNIPPVALKLNGRTKPQQVRRARISGNIYLMPTEDLIYLDKHRTNGVAFQRKRVKLVVPALDHEGLPITVRAWMYLGADAHWGPQIQWNDQYYKGRQQSCWEVHEVHKHQHSWISDYYQFQKEL